MAGPGAEKQTWSDIAKRLDLSRSYWLVTTNPDGSPHAAPVWGVVVDDALCLYSERTTVKARNLARDRRAVVHLESAEDVLIVHGELEDRGGPVEVPEVVEALKRKYDRPDDEAYLPSSDNTSDVVYSLRARRALLWSLSDYESSQRRWAAPPQRLGEA